LAATFNKYRELWGGLAAVVLALVLFFIPAALGWPGTPDSCTTDVPNTCYCENFVRPGEWVKQPANTWSNLGFITVGLLILWQIGNDRATPATQPNPMITATAYALGYAAVALFLGPGSMFFHGSLTQWGGWIDTYSLILFGSFGLLYALARIFDWSGTLFVLLYVGVNIVLGIFTWFVDGTGTPFFAVLVAAWVLTEGVILWRKPGGLQRDWPWLGAALGTFAVALVIWSLSQTGRPLCNPDSLIQGHAIWHIMSAVVAGCVFLYLRTETPPSPV
jgi:hypothetical protein